MSTLQLNRVIKFFSAVLVFAFSASAFAVEPIYSSGFFSSKAIGGYDTVAYFTEGKAVKGKSDFSTEYKGAKWVFSSKENLELFKAEPEKYAPQYGGYCAWAAAHNVVYKTDPTQWHIHEGKLYLNADSKIKKQWLEQKVAKIKDADANWPGLIN